MKTEEIKNLEDLIRFASGEYGDKAYLREKAEGGFRFGAELVHGIMGLQNCDIGIFRSGCP